MDEDIAARGDDRSVVRGQAVSSGHRLGGGQRST